MWLLLRDLEIVLDDRGARVKVHSPNPAKVADDPELAGVLQRVNETHLTDQRFGRMVLFGVLGGIFIIAAAIALTAWLPSAFPWIVPIILVGMGLIVAFAKSMSDRPKKLQRRVASLLFAGRCASCGYDLRQQTDDSDGLRVCPECSAAWHGTRVGTALPPETELMLRADTPGDSPPVFTNLLRSARRSGAVADDRDRSVPIVHYTLPGLDSWMPEAEVAPMRLRVRRATAAGRVGCGLMFLLFLVWMVGSQIVNMMLGGPMHAILPLFIIICGCGPMSITVYRLWTGRSGGTSRTIASVLKDHSICPSCTTNLAGIMPESDGCAICPSCRAAWKIPTPAPTAQLGDPSRGHTST